MRPDKYDPDFRVECSGGLSMNNWEELASKFLRELAKHERTSPEKASARIAKLKSNLATRKKLTAGKRWNSIRCKWE